MELPDAVDAVRPSVVQIGVRLPNTELPRMVGTGFIVDDRGTIVTAWHVIEGLFDLARASGVTDRPTFIDGLAHPQLFEAGGQLLGMQGFTFVDLDLLIAVPDHDLGVARMTENVVTGDSDLSQGPLIDGVRIPPLVAVATLHTKRPREGAAVGVSGYPFAVNSLITNSGCIASAFFPTFAVDPIPEPPAVTEEVDLSETWKQVETFTPGAQPGERYLADLEVNGGNKGRPGLPCRVGGGHRPVRGDAPRGGDTPRPACNRRRRTSDLQFGLTVVIPSFYVAAALRDPRVKG